MGVPGGPTGSCLGYCRRSTRLMRRPFHAFHDRALEFSISGGLTAWLAGRCCAGIQPSPARRRAGGWAATMNRRLTPLGLADCRAAASHSWSLGMHGAQNARRERVGWFAVPSVSGGRLTESGVSDAGAARLMRLPCPGGLSPPARRECTDGHATLKQRPARALSLAYSSVVRAGPRSSRRRPSPAARRLRAGAAVESARGAQARRDGQRHSNSEARHASAS
jgi:hypothetical protein